MLNPGSIVHLVHNGEPVAALVSRVIEATKTIEGGPLSRSYDVTVVAARTLPDVDGALPRVPELYVTNWQSDAAELTTADPDHTYGWIRSGTRGG